MHINISKHLVCISITISTFAPTKHYNIMELKHLFKNRFGQFYIPENAEDETEYYDFESFSEEITDCWDKDEILRNSFPICEDLIGFAISNISWMFPSTFVNDISDSND